MCATTIAFSLMSHVLYLFMYKVKRFFDDALPIPYVPKITFLDRGVVDLLCAVFQEMGASVSEEELRELIAEVDINQNATIEEEEFLQVCVCGCVCMCVCACVRVSVCVCVCM